MPQSTGVAVQPLVGHLAGRAGLDADHPGAEEREDLAALPRPHLEDRVLVVPRVVGPGTGERRAHLLHLRYVHAAPSGQSSDSSSSSSRRPYFSAASTIRRTLSMAPPSSSRCWLRSVAAAT